MKKTILLMFLVAGAVGTILAQARSVAGQTNGIMVNDADGVVRVGMSQSQSLEEAMGRVSPRVVQQFGQGHLYAPLKIDQELHTLLEGVPPRVYAHASQGFGRYPMQPPQEIMQARDQASPVITDTVKVTPAGNNAVLEFTTSEFATVTIRYGSASGSYSQEVVITIYAQVHSIQLDLSKVQQQQLAQTQRYYYIIEMTDRSGNTTTTPEDSFTLTGDEATPTPPPEATPTPQPEATPTTPPNSGVDVYLYLPLVRR